VISKRIANALVPTTDHWLPNDIAVILVITGTIELFAWWLKQKNPLSIAKIAEIHDRIVASPTVHSGEDVWPNVRSSGRDRFSGQTRKKTVLRQPRKIRKSGKR
jgi:hypothetical protein